MKTNEKAEVGMLQLKSHANLAYEGWSEGNLAKFKEHSEKVIAILRVATNLAKEQVWSRYGRNKREE